MRKTISFLTLLSVFFFTACVSSRTTEQRASSVTEESSSLYVSDSEKAVEVQKGAASTTLTDRTHLTADVGETGTNEETISEQITETYDTDGKKTIKTNRTIQRNGNHAKQTQVAGSILHQEQALKQYIDSLNREWGTHLDAQKKSLEKADSTNKVSDKNTSDIKPEAGWGRAKQILLVAVLFGLLIGTIRYVYSFKK